MILGGNWLKDDVAFETLNAYLVWQGASFIPSYFNGKFSYPLVESMFICEKYVMENNVAQVCDIYQEDSENKHQIMF